MTRQEIEATYRVENGVIRSPGKFEGEMVYVPFFWEVYLNGFANSDDGTVISFLIEPDDKVMFPELKRRRRVRLVQRDDGFVVEI